MTITEIIELVGLLVAIIAGIVVIIRGRLKDFIVEQMKIAETKYEAITDPLEKSKLKFTYVVEQVKEKYKLVALFLNIKKFIEKIIDISKHINSK